MDGVNESAGREVKGAGECTRRAFGFHVESYEVPRGAEARRALQLQLTVDAGARGWSIAAGTVVTTPSQRDGDHERAELLVIFQREVARDESP